MSNVIDVLLALDSDKLELPTKKIKIKRLSDITGSDVIFSLQGISQNRIIAIREKATSIHPQTKEININRQEIEFEMILTGVKSPNLRDEKLLKHYGVHTPYDLISKLLLPGEIESLSDLIGELSGFNGDVVEEVKN